MYKLLEQNSLIMTSVKPPKHNGTWFLYIELAVVYFHDFIISIAAIHR